MLPEDPERLGRHRDSTSIMLWTTAGVLAVLWVAILGSLCYIPAFQVRLFGPSRGSCSITMRSARYVLTTLCLGWMASFSIGMSGILFHRPISGGAAEVLRVYEPKYVHGAP